MKKIVRYYIIIQLLLSVILIYMPTRAMPVYLQKFLSCNDGHTSTRLHRESRKIRKSIKGHR